MPTPAIRAEGLDELRRDLRRVKNKELDAELKKIHKDLAIEITRRAAPMVPIGETRKLWMSLRGTGTLQDAVGRAGKASVPYAPIIHWGWAARGIPARPFLREAAAQIETDIVDRYDREVAGMLDRVIGTT